MCAAFGRRSFHEGVAAFFRQVTTLVFVRHFAAVALFAVVLLTTSGCGYTPALESEDGFRAVDALYTALTSRRAELVTSVEADLRQLHSKGQLSPDVMGSLSAIIEKARSGSWQKAAEDLDYFIRNQPEPRHAH